MRRFSERDVRRCYDLLQHKDRGLTQFNAVDHGNIIGIGLFDNEEDFTSECLRYNALGHLYVGVNPRSQGLLDRYGGLKNRVRSVLVEIVEPGDVDLITGVAVPGKTALTRQAKALRRDTSLMHDRESFFALGRPLEAEKVPDIKRWLVADPDAWDYSVDQYVRIPGTALPGGGWLSPRVVFRRYRPYVLSEVSDALSAAADD